MRHKALIIDDNPVAVCFLEGVLKTQEYEVFTAGTAQRGADLAQKTIPELLLVQGKLPGGSGIAVINHLRRKQATRDIPVVYYTGSHKEKMRFRLNPPANTWYLHSPWDASRLLDIMREEICLQYGDGHYSNLPGGMPDLERRIL